MCILGHVDKEYLTIEQQIEQLQARGLVINDIHFAREALFQTGYYELINGYKDVFLKTKDPEEVFIERTTIESLVDLYEFDRDLRFLFFSTFDHLENFVKQQVSTVLSTKYGYMQKDYLRESNFREGYDVTRKDNLTGEYHKVKKVDGTTRKQRDELFVILNKDINLKKEPIRHYKQRHGNVPPWILLKELTLGQLRIFISLMLREDKIALAKLIFYPEALKGMSDSEVFDLMGDFMSVLWRYRNRTFHGGRIYNYYPDTKYMKFYDNVHPFVGFSKKKKKENNWHNINIMVWASLARSIHSNFFGNFFIGGVLALTKDLNKLRPEEKTAILNQMEIPSNYEDILEKLINLNNLPFK